MEGRNHDGNGRPDAKGGAAIAPRPASRAGEIASRSNTPTPEVMASAVWAGVQGIFTGDTEDRDLRSMCRGVGTIVSVARNASHVDALCDRMAQEEMEAKRRRKAELEAELARLRDAG